jgi:hypothetical protein
VIGLPASICCQCLAENPNEIMSSWLKRLPFRSPRTRSPNRAKNFARSGTSEFVEFHEQKHHEQISCVAFRGNYTVAG